MDATSSTSHADAELEREEEEMLAVTRLLKQVDEKEAVIVTKKLILEASGSSQLSSGASIESNMDDQPEESGTVRQDKAMDQSSHGKEKKL